MSGTQELLPYPVQHPQERASRVAYDVPNMGEDRKPQALGASGCILCGQRYGLQKLQEVVGKRLEPQSRPVGTFAPCLALG